MSQKAYDPFTAEVIAKLITNIPKDLPAGSLQNCIEHPSHFQKLLRDGIQNDPILRFGMWFTAPKDAVSMHGLLTVPNDKAWCEESLRSHLSEEGQGLYANTLMRARLSKIATFDSQVLVKVPRWDVIYTKTDVSFEEGYAQRLFYCNLESGPRCFIKKKAIRWDPHESILFYTPHEGDMHFAIDVDQHGRPNLRIAAVKNIRYHPYTHIVFQVK